MAVGGTGEIGRSTGVVEEMVTGLVLTAEAS